ncbi:MAG: redoxin domain-containing protein [Rhizobium sp.]|nr:MAG: redoxin domain-containing protein [Rhizobium sp.]
MFADIQAHRRQEFRALREGAEYLIVTRQAVRALCAGSRAPSFRLADQDGVAVSSEFVLSRGPIVLTLYSDTWCPTCTHDRRARPVAGGVDLPTFTGHGSGPADPRAPIVVAARRGTWAAARNAASRIAPRERGLSCVKSLHRQSMASRPVHMSLSTNGREDRRRDIPCCYGNDRYRLLENIVRRCDQWPPLSQISSSNAEG